MRLSDAHKLLPKTSLMSQIGQDHHCWVYVGHIHLELLEYDFTSSLQNKTQFNVLIHQNLTYKNTVRQV